MDSKNKLVSENEEVLIHQLIDLLIEIVYLQDVTDSDYIVTEDLVHKLLGYATLEAYVEANTDIRKTLLRRLTQHNQDLGSYDI